MSAPTDKQYIGDGVYAEFDGYAFVVTTENGIRTTNRIVFEAEVLEALLGYVRRVHAHFGAKEAT